MKTVLTAAIVLASCVMHAAPAHTHGYDLGDLLIVHPWAKPSLKGVPNGAAYMVISNSGDSDDVLISVASDAARAAEMHAMEMADGVMRMRPIEGGVSLPAGKTVVFEPGGKHIMLIGLKKPLTTHDSFNVMLTFEKAGEHQIKVEVLDAAPETAGDGS